jgi:hypothetical protein
LYGHVLIGLGYAPETIVVGIRYVAGKFGSLGNARHPDLQDEARNQRCFIYE